MYGQRPWSIPKHPNPSTCLVNAEATLADRVTEAALVALTFLGWVVLTYVVFALPVSPGAQAVLYTAGFVAIAGSTALVCELYQSRTRRHGAPRRAVLLLGTGMRFALAVEFALWLQSLRVLTAGYVVLLVGAFLFLEFLAKQAADDRDRARG